MIEGGYTIVADNVAADGYMTPVAGSREHALGLPCERPAHLLCSTSTPERWCCWTRSAAAMGWRGGCARRC